MVLGLGSIWPPSAVQPEEIGLVEQPEGKAKKIRRRRRKDGPVAHGGAWPNASASMRGDS